MTETKTTYSDDIDITITLTGPLTTGLYRSSANVDNSSLGYVDAIVGGMIGSAGTSWAAGDTVDIYIGANYSDTTTDITGARDTAYALGDGVQTGDTDLIHTNLRYMTSIGLHGTPTTNMDYHWGPIGVAQFFGGVMPKDWHIVIHNNTGGSIDSGNLNYIGITYTHL